MVSGNASSVAEPCEAAMRSPNSHRMTRNIKTGPATVLVITALSRRAARRCLPKCVATVDSQVVACDTVAVVWLVMFPPLESGDKAPYANDGHGDEPAQCFDSARPQGSAT